MLKNIGYDKCSSFIKCQLRQPEGEGAVQTSIKPAITISRMVGAGGYTVAAKLAEYLQTHVPARCEWTVFDRNLIEKVLEDHHLHKRIADFMAENKHKSMITDSMEEYLGLHPSSWTLVQHTAETIHLTPRAHGVCDSGGPGRQRDHRHAAERLSRSFGGIA